MLRDVGRKTWTICPYWTYYWTCSKRIIPAQAEHVHRLHMHSRVKIPLHIFLFNNKNSKNPKTSSKDTNICEIVMISVGCLLQSHFLDSFEAWHQLSNLQGPTHESSVIRNGVKKKLYAIKQANAIMQNEERLVHKFNAPWGGQWPHPRIIWHNHGLQCWGSRLLKLQLRSVSNQALLRHHAQDSSFHCTHLLCPASWLDLADLPSFLRLFVREAKSNLHRRWRCLLNQKVG